MFKMKFILILICILLIFSCGEGIIEEDTDALVITNISKSDFYLGDTIQIEGSGFGIANNNSYYWFVNNTDTLWFSSLHAKTWSPNFIEIVIDEKYDINEIWISKLKQSVAKSNLRIYPYPEIEVVTISSGSLEQGDKTGFSDERVVRNVSITKDFVVSKTEITQAVWELIMNYNNSPNINSGLPVSNVSFREAIEFCNELSKLNGLDSCYVIEDQEISFDKESKGWRLPTEAEWEYIASLANIESDKIESFSWFNENSGFNSQIVGTKSQDKIGLFDLYGNVWEWCWDFYSKEYEEGDVIDPTGSEIGERRVRRGGSYNNGKVYLRKSNRTVPSNNISTTGIRLVRTL